MPGYRVIIEERTFDDMDRNNNDLIDWWEFVIPMCVRKLSERRKVLIYSGSLFVSASYERVKGAMEIEYGYEVDL